MITINDVLKINGLIYLLLGAFLVFFPENMAPFLSESATAPKMPLLVSGVVFNLLGLLQLWLAKTNPVPKTPLLLLVFAAVIWVIAIIALIQFEIGITSINGITTAGLVTIVIGWMAWIQLKHYLSNKQ